MKNKSKILTISTFINTIIGIEAIIVVGYVFVIFDSLSIDALAQFIAAFMSMVLLFSAIPIFLIFFIPIVAIKLISAWVSFKTNKKLWTIIHIVALIIVSLITVFLEGLLQALEQPVAVTFFSGWFIFAIILRIIGYFQQKKINIEIL